MWRGLVRTRNFCLFLFLPENKMLVDSYFVDTKSFPTVYQLVFLPRWHSLTGFVKVTWRSESSSSQLNRTSAEGAREMLQVLQCHQDSTREETELKDGKKYSCVSCLLERWEVFAASMSQIKFIRLDGGEQALKNIILSKLCPLHGSCGFLSEWCPSQVQSSASTLCPTVRPC